jgi:thiopurine S-methyltransferase
MDIFPPEYWDNFYRKNKLAWDIGYVSPPLKEYFNQLKDKNIRILIPGAGNGWEVEYLYKSGFKNTFLLDFSNEAINLFQKRFPEFPEENILNEDFFYHYGTYDLIVEQTFFSSLPVNKRNDYVTKMYNLLNEGGKLVGLLFKRMFYSEEPPYGGSEKEYIELFKNSFSFIYFEEAYNSIKPRKHNELFVLLLKD